jgi:hypothetical protein
MKFTLAIPLFLATTSLAAPFAEPALEPVDIEAIADLETRQFSSGTTSNEFTSGGCRDVIFFFARGSTETGNMVC